MTDTKLSRLKRVPQKTFVISLLGSYHKPTHYGYTHYGDTYYATILSRLSMHKERHGDAAGAALLTQVSSVAWQHINFCGRYEFTKRADTINIAAIIQTLAQAPVPQPLAL